MNQLWEKKKIIIVRKSEEKVWIQERVTYAAGTQRSDGLKYN